MRAYRVKPRTASFPQIAATTPEAATATSSTPSKPEPAPIAPKTDAAHRRAKRNAAKFAAKAAVTTTNDERRESTPPAAPAKKKFNRDQVFVAFATLIAVAA